MDAASSQPWTNSLSISWNRAPHSPTAARGGAEVSVVSKNGRFLRWIGPNESPRTTKHTQGRRMKSACQKRHHVLVIPGGLLATRPHADPGCSVPPHEVN